MGLITFYTPGLKIVESFDDEDLYTVSGLDNPRPITNSRLLQDSGLRIRETKTGVS